MPVVWGGTPLCDKTVIVNLADATIIALDQIAKIQCVSRQNLVACIVLILGARVDEKGLLAQ